MHNLITLFVVLKPVISHCMGEPMCAAHATSSRALHPPAIESSDTPSGGQPCRLSSHQRDKPSHRQHRNGTSRLHVEPLSCFLSRHCRGDTSIIDASLDQVQSQPVATVIQRGMAPERPMPSRCLCCRNISDETSSGNGPTCSAAGQP